MKRILFSLSILLCTYSLRINADQLTDDLTDLTQALLKLEQVITNQPAIPLVPIATGPTIEEQIQINLNDLDIIRIMLDNSKTLQQQIPLSQTELDIWRMELAAFNDDMQFFKTNAPNNTDAQTKAINIKDFTVEFLVYLKTLVLNKDQAATLLQYIDELYTNGVAQPAYQTLLGDMSASNATIEQLKSDLNAIINIEQQAQTNLDDLDTIQMMLNNFKTVQQPRSIPLSSTDLDTWRTELVALSNDIQFLKANTPSNIDAQTKIIAIKDSVVDFLVYLKTLVLTQDQATTLLQYIDEFYTNGVAQPDYQTLLGDMSTSNATIEQLKNDLNVIIQTQTNLDDLDTIQMMLNNFKTVQQPRIIPLSATDLDTWRTELTALKNDIQFFKANAPDNVDAQTKIIAIKDSIVDFLVYLKTLALTENQATTLLQYIDEFYTNGVAQPDYQTLLGDMSASNVTIEQLKNDLNAIINPVTPLVPAPTPTEPLTPLVPMPEETQPVTPLIPTPEQTQPLTPLVPAPEKTQPLTPLIPVPEQTQPLIPTTPVVPESFKPYIEKLLSNIQLDQPRIDALFTSGDTDTINSFMTKTVADLRNYAQSFSDYSVKINTYYKYLTDEQKQIVLKFLNSIQTGLGTDGMKTLPNLQKAQSDVNTLLQKINP